MSKAVGTDYRYNLIQDHLLTEWPPVAENIDNAFLTLQNVAGTAPVTELLTVNDKDELLHFFREPESNSGWAHEARLVDGAPAEKAIAKLIGFYQEETLFALAHYRTAGVADQVIGMQKTLDRGWAAMPMSNDLRNALGAMRETDMFVDDAGIVFVYGISTQISPAPLVIVSAHPQSKEWGIVFEEPSEDGATYRLLPGTGGEQITVMTVKGPNVTFRGGSIVQGQFQWGKAPAITHNLGQGNITARQIFPVPATGSDDGFLLLTDTDVLYHVNNYFGTTPKVTRLTGGTEGPSGAMQVSVGLDSQRRWMIFVVDPEGRSLWLLRETQQSSASEGVVDFAHWVPLGNTLSNIACPQIMTAGPELFFYDLQAKINHMHQEIADEGGTWFTIQIASPSAPDTAPVPATTYTQELIAVDAQGSPVPNSAMTVHSDRKTVLVVNGISHHAGPGEPAAIVTDARGIATIATEAATLCAPKLRASMGEFNPETDQIWYRADQRVHQRLAGKDPNFPITGAGMQKRGLLPQKMPAAQTELVTEKIVMLAGAAFAMHTKNEGSTIPDACFLMDFDERGRIGLHDLDQTAYDTKIQSSSDAIGGIFSHIFGDVAHFFKHALDEVKSIGVKIVDGVVHFTINGVTYLLTTIDAISNAIELVFAKIFSIFKEVIAVVEKLIEWLRMLLDFENYCRTADAFAYLVNNALVNLGGYFKGDISKFVQQEFNGLKSTLIDTVNNIENLFGADVTFESLMSGANSLKVSPRPTPAEQITAWQSAQNVNSVQCNYVQTKAQTRLGELLSSSAMPLSTSGAPDVSVLIDAFTKSFNPQQLETTLKQAIDLLAKVQDPKAFLALPIQEVLLAVKEVLLLAIDGIEAILIALCELAGSAIEKFQKLIDTPIDIPIISWIYKEITGSELTLLNLLCLAVAVPVTILYEFTFQKAPFPSRSSVEQFKAQPLPWPSLPGTIAKKQVGADGEPLEGWAGIALILNVITWILYGPADAFGDTRIEDHIPCMLGDTAIIIEAALTQMLGAPWTIIAQSEHTLTETFIIVAWAAAWCPIIADTIFEVANTRTITRIPIFGEIDGALISMTLGCVLLGIGSYAVELMREEEEKYPVSMQAVTLLPAFPVLFKPAGLFLYSRYALQFLDLGASYGTVVALLVGPRPDKE